MISGISLAQGGYNNISNLWEQSGTLIPRVLQSYIRVIMSFFYPNGLRTFINSLAQWNVSALCQLIQFSFPTLLNWVLGVFGAYKFFSCLASKILARDSRILAVVLVLAMPVAMDMTYVMGGPWHDLTKCGYWLFYVFVLLLAGLDSEQSNTHCGLFSEKSSSGYALVSGCILIWIVMNVQLANTAYIKKEIVNQSTLATMTRVLTKLEQMDGYMYGETPVAFIGHISLQTPVKGTEKVDGITGMGSNSAITYQSTYARYFENELQYDIQVCDSEKTDELMNLQYVKDMGVFPAKDSVQMIDGIAVVKMGNQ